jgi:hypothetical protein
MTSAFSNIQEFDCFYFFNRIRKQIHIHSIYSSSENIMIKFKPISKSSFILYSMGFEH